MSDRFKWTDVIEKPMNPNAEADLMAAIEEAKKAPFMAMSSDITEATEHRNKAVIEWRTNGAWQDFVAILLNNGYDVEIRHQTIFVTDEIEISWLDK